jgi:hypothetical protein
MAMAAPILQCDYPPRVIPEENKRYVNDGARKQAVRGDFMFPSCHIPEITDEHGSSSQPINSNVEIRSRAIKRLASPARPSPSSNFLWTGLLYPFRLFRATKLQWILNAELLRGSPCSNGVGDAKGAGNGAKQNTSIPCQLP